MAMLFFLYQPCRVAKVGHGLWSFKKIKKNKLGTYNDVAELFFYCLCLDFLLNRRDSGWRTCQNTGDLIGLFWKHQCVFNTQRGSECLMSWRQRVNVNTPLIIVNGLKRESTCM